ncbi:hypothetical protein RAB80_000684 [Fusarium oxysporum f. sp. vasinfectum]|nr:hypothetical protein RAB80_000684 [Fusarium oxysporum f. sp. vasinfectum]KAK2937998.1 hypothetical protein FoTM2_001216 [Fusarium oxysporum f. sp. vasinfectum]
MHYNGETDWMDDFESDSAASGSGKQHKNCPTRDTRPRRDISSSSEYLSKDDSLSSKDARPDVSPLHMSEVGISAPPKKVSHSTLRGQLSETEADACPAPLHSHATDVFSNNSVAQGRQNVNDELVEAISRNIAQQLHMLSIKDTTHLHPTKKSSKPLPEPPHPDPSSTATEQSCRLSVDDVSPSTPEKDILDKDKAKVSSDRRTKYGSSSISPNHVTVCSRGFSGRKIGRPNVPKRTSSIRSLRAANQDYDQDRVLDRDVLRGLHIASSAACNEQIDSFIHEKTGLHIRQFLADLMPLESLGNEPVRESKEERSRRRRADIREVKRRARKSRQMRERAMV